MIKTTITLITLCVCVAALAGIARAEESDNSREAATAIIAATPVTAEEPDGIEITASKEATFDSKKNVAIFVGDVVVKDVRFQLRADKLIAYLDPDEGGLKRAEAIGHVVIVQVADGLVEDEKNQRSVGRAEKAVYNPKDGSVILTGWPQVKQGINLHKSTEASTRMVLDPQGKMKTYGRSKTIIQDKAGTP